MSVINSFYQGNTSAKRIHELSPYHDEMKGKTYIHQPGRVPTTLDEFVTVKYVYDNGVSFVRNEKGKIIPVYTKNLREVPRMGVAL